MKNEERTRSSWKRHEHERKLAEKRGSTGQKKKEERWDGTKTTKSTRIDTETLDLAVTEIVRRKQHTLTL